MRARPDVRLRHASLDDAAFAHDCLSELRDGVRVSREAFEVYLRAVVVQPQVSILIAESGRRRVGLVTLNRFVMPRYVGYGYEIEEFVVAPAHRRCGIGRQMLTLLIEMCGRDPQARKLVVKSNTIGATLYATMMLSLIHI